jgi:hypothetical protein
MLPFFGSCIIHILHTGCAKIKKKKSGAKGITKIWQQKLKYRDALCHHSNLFITNGKGTCLSKCGTVVFYLLMLRKHHIMTRRLTSQHSNTQYASSALFRLHAQQMYPRSCRIITALRQAQSTRRDSHIGASKGQLSSVMMPHRLVTSYRRFGEACCLNLSGLSCNSSIISLKDSRASRFWKEQSQNEDVRTAERLQEGSWKRVQKKERQKNKMKILLFSHALSEGA